MTAEEIISHNLRLSVVFNALRAIFLGNAVMTTYYLAQGLTQAQIFLLQTILCVVSTASDVPFGYLADRIGIRKVMIIGSVVMLAQGIYFNFCQTFWQFAVALVGTGLYIASLENTANALMTKSLKLLEDTDEAEQQYKAYLNRSHQATNVAYACASLVAGAIVWLGGLSMPFYLQPIIWVSACYTALKVIDPPVKEHAEHADWQMFIKSLRTMLVDDKLIRYIILLYAGFRLHVMLCFWILQPRMAQAGVPEVMYGFAYFLWAMLNTALSNQLQSLQAESSMWFWTRTVLTCSLGAYMAGATTNIAGFLALMFGLTLISLFVERLFNDFMHRKLPGDGIMRNTELSVGSTIPTLVYAIAAPFFGMLVDGTSLSTSFFVLSCVCLLFTGASLILFWRAARSC